MKDTFNEFIVAYKNANQDLKDIIDSEIIGIFVDELLENKVKNNLKSKLIVLVSNRLLNIIQNSDLINNLIEIGIPEIETKSLSSKIENFVQKTLEKNVEPEGPINIDKEIKETEAVLNSMNHIRTMSGDKEAIKETVHVSSQFDLFGRKDKKVNDSEETRWGTDK